MGRAYQERVDRWVDEELRKIDLANYLLKLQGQQNKASEYVQRVRNSESPSTQK